MEGIVSVIEATTRLLLAVVMAGAIHLAAPAATVASAVCPPPGTLADIIAVDADDRGPLTEAFPPIYGPYAEGAAACWPGQGIVFTAFVQSSPEGLGGRGHSRSSRPGSARQAHFLSTSADVDAESDRSGRSSPSRCRPGSKERSRP